MDKNPISFLQEYTMSRMKVTPIYTVITQETGTHINSFNIKVVCNDYTANGVGASKKEAKQNAALKMIDLLEIDQNKLQYSLPILNVTKNSNHVHLTQKSPSTPGINYVGKLQEFAAFRGPLPEYECKNIHGPSHDPQFTFTCKYQELVEEATGSTKKEAKMLVAQKMYVRTSSETKIVVPKSQIKSYMDTMSDGIRQIKLFEDNQNLMKKSAEKAMQNYPKLCKTTIVKSSSKDDKNSYNNYHTILRDTFSVRERELVIDKLQDTMDACKSYLSLGDTIINPMALLKGALQAININIREVKYHMQSNCAIFGLQLETNPVISEIGYGKSKKEAEIMAIFHIAKTVSIMLL